MPEPEPEPFNPLASLAVVAERAMDQLVRPVLKALSDRLLAPITRTVDANPELLLNIAVAWDALERVKTTDAYHLTVGAITHRVQSHPLGHLHASLPPRAALEFWLTVEEHGEAGILETLEQAVRSQGFLRDLRAAVEQAQVQAPVHDEAARSQLLTGIDYVAAGRWPLAYPLLIIPLEGMVRTVATSRSLIDARGRLRTTRNWTGVETLLKLLGLQPDFELFLKREVYGSTGNAYRHGTPPSGRVRK